MKQNIYSIKRIYEYDVSCRITSYLKERGCPLSSAQRDALYDEIKELSPLYEKKSQKYIPNIWWRLSGIFFVAILFILFLASPVKWICTGNLKYDINKLSVFAKWGNKIGINTV
jgi:hypothetical protein